jgi:hypothetical protein
MSVGASRLRSDHRPPSPLRNPARPDGGRSSRLGLQVGARRLAATGSAKALAERNIQPVLDRIGYVLVRIEPLLGRGEGAGPASGA